MATIICWHRRRVSPSRSSLVHSMRLALMLPLFASLCSTTSIRVGSTGLRTAATISAPLRRMAGLDYRSRGLSTSAAASSTPCPLVETPPAYGHLWNGMILASRGYFFPVAGKRCSRRLSFCQTDSFLLRRTRVGYSGGLTSFPTYRSMGDHTECIQVIYNPEEIKYDDLLEIMFKEHGGYLSKPYSVQYRSGVWYQDEDQKNAVDAKIKEIEQATGRKVFTHVAPLSDFYMAEEYHQKYMEKNRASSPFGGFFS